MTAPFPHPPCLTHLRTLPRDATPCSGALQGSSSPPEDNLQSPAWHSQTMCLSQLLPCLPLIPVKRTLLSLHAHHSPISALDLQLPCAVVSPVPKCIAPWPSKQDATAVQTLPKACSVLSYTYQLPLWAPLTLLVALGRTNVLQSDHPVASHHRPSLPRSSWTGETPCAGLPGKTSLGSLWSLENQL